MLSRKKESVRRVRTWGDTSPSTNDNQLKVFVVLDVTETICRFWLHDVGDIFLFQYPCEDMVNIISETSHEKFIRNVHEQIEHHFDNKPRQIRFLFAKKLTDGDDAIFNGLPCER